MLSQHTINSSNETLFETIYQLAKNKNEEALKDIIKKGSCISAFQGKYNPIMLLAKEGDSESVDFLIDKFGANRNDAAFGYAIGGHVHRVNEQIAQGASRDYTVYSYANAGHVAQVNRQIAQGASRKNAAKGYAQGEQIDQGNILRLMSFTNDEELRELLAEKANKKTESLNTRSLLKKSRKLNELIRNKGLTYNQAQEYLKTAANGWLFQGQDLVRNNRIPPETYIHILSFVTGCSQKDTLKIFTTANERITERVVNLAYKASNGFFSWFQPKKSKDAAKAVAKTKADAAEDRCQKRLTLS